MMRFLRINASIIANTGFVARFATSVGKNGKPALESPILSGWSSIMSCGQIIGMTTLPFLSSRYGRKIAMYTYWVILVGSVIAECLARSWPGWLVAKLLAGIGVGCLQSTVPTYISEVAPTRIRGGLLMCYSFWWTLGSFFAQVALQHLSKDDPTNYITPIYTQWAQIGLMILIYVFVPESPAWCVNAGKHDQAKKHLLKLNRGVPNYDLERQFQVLVMAVEHEREVAAEQRREKWYAIFQGTNGLRTVISFWTNLTQQLIGLSLFGTFGTYFFQQAGLADPFKIKVITNSIQIATVIVIILVADRVGRRLLACSGTTLCWVSCVAIGIVGVCPRVNASTYVFILFACLWSEYLPSTDNPSTNSSIRHRFGCQRCDWLGIYRRGFVPASQTIHCWLRSSRYLRCWRCDECARSLHDQQQQVELELENRMVLRRPWSSLCCRHVAPDSRDYRVRP